MGFREWSDQTMQIFLKDIASMIKELRKTPRYNFDGAGIATEDITLLYSCRKMIGLPTAPLREMILELTDNETQYITLQAEVLEKHYDMVMKTPEEGGIYKPTSESGIIIKSLMSEVQKIFSGDMREAREMVEEENRTEEKEGMEEEYAGD